MGTTGHLRQFKLPAVDETTGLVNAVIEATRGSRFKYKFQPKVGEFVLHKALPVGASFPFDFGFVPATTAEDGDPLDILLLLDEPSIVGSIVPTRLIGVISAEQTESGKKVRNDRLLGVLETPYNPPRFRSLDELEPQMLDEIEHFFISFNEMEGRVFKIVGRGDADRARQLIAGETGAPKPASKKKGRSGKQRSSSKH